MSKKDILDLFSANAYSINIKNALLMMIASLLVGIVIYITYYLCSEKTVYNKKFNLSLIIVTLITNVIMLLISSNIVVSLGMVGALSIVRFRTAVKDSRDTVFIFWAIAEGLAVGTKSFKLTLVSVIFIAAILLIGSKLLLEKSKYVLAVVAETTKLDVAILEDKLQQNKCVYRMRSTNVNETRSEYIYEIRYKGENLEKELISTIMSVNGVKSVNCVIITGEIEG